ncbi:hypothetical protein ACC708_36645, partial [Rhizobium ruizarguesonis]
MLRARAAKGEGPLGIGASVLLDALTMGMVASAAGMTDIELGSGAQKVLATACKAKPVIAKKP